MRRWLLFFCATIVWAAEPGSSQQLLEWMNAVAQRQLDARDETIRGIRTMAEAQARQQAVREKLLSLIGGLPDYQGPLNPEITGTIAENGYRIEKVIFTSLPGILVTANLYVPSASGTHPGILLPIGHWDEGKAAVQIIAANLARKGFVVLAYDPVGQAERLHAYDARFGNSLAGGSTEQHLILGGQSLLLGQSFARYRIWDAKRALDYLVSRPEVDAGRIGCTGCSGGGTVATYISALDSRIKVAAPACYLTSYRELFAGPIGDSEQTIPGFLAAHLDLTDFVELFAPKPWLILSTEQDFFPLAGARRVYEESRHWYDLFDAPNRVAWTVGPGGHGTPLPVRERLYGWMIQWLMDGHGSAPEEPIRMHTTFDLWATPRGQVTLLPRTRDLTSYLREQVRPPDQPWNWAPEPSQPRVRTIRAGEETAATKEDLAFTVDANLEFRATYWKPKAAGPHPAVLVVEGRPHDRDVAKQLVERGASVLLMSPRGLPGATTGRQYSAAWQAPARELLIGRDLTLDRASDILTAAGWLASQTGAGIHAYASERPAVWLLLAAEHDPKIERLWLDHAPYSFASAMEDPLARGLYEALIPGILRRTDLPLLRSRLGAKVLWSDPTDWLGNVTAVSGEYRYRLFEEGDDKLIGEFLGGVNR